MHTGTETAYILQLWKGRITAVAAILILILDGVVDSAPIDAIAELGRPANPGLARVFGVISLVGAGLYSSPPTTFSGAILLTAYLGGAIAKHLRAGSQRAGGGPSIWRFPC